jgi:hypothetical protein
VTRHALGGGFGCEIIKFVSGFSGIEGIEVVFKFECRRVIYVLLGSFFGVIMTRGQVRVPDSTDESHGRTSPVGLVFMAAYTLCDAFTWQWQARLYREVSASLMWQWQAAPLQGGQCFVDVALAGSACKRLKVVECHGCLKCTNVEVRAHQSNISFRLKQVHGVCGDAKRIT